MIPSPAFDALRAYVHTEGAPNQPYLLEAHLEAFDTDRDQALAYALEVWGLQTWTLTRLKEVHAWGLALGQELHSFPPGPYAFHRYNGLDDLFGEGEIFLSINETLSPSPTEAGLQILADQLPLSIEELRHLSPQALQHVLRDHDREELWNQDTCPRLAEANDLETLLRQVMREQWLSIEHLWHDDQPEPPARLDSIQDATLHQQALALEGSIHQMQRVDTPQQLYLCDTVLMRRPGWELLYAWESEPHARQAWCILHAPT